MAITGIDIYETKEYVSKFDPDKENPTIFEIGLLDPKIKAWLEDKSSSFSLSSENPDDMANMKMDIAQRNIEVFRFGVKDIKNLIHPQTKKPVEFKTTAVVIKGKSYNIVSDEIIALVPEKIRTEVTLKILDETNFSKSGVMEGKK